MGRATVEVLVSAHSIPADGSSYATVRLKFDPAATGMVELRLRGVGSFDPHVSRRQLSVPLRSGEAQITIHAPRRPGEAMLIGPGIRQRIRFRPTSWLQGLVHEWAPTLALALAIALVLRSFAFASYYVPSASMLDTLHLGDVFIAEKFTYRVLDHTPRRGDIVVFTHPDQSGKVLVKRVIGLSGDKISLVDGDVFINDQPLSERYLGRPDWSDFEPTVVPAGQYFVMGDNRSHSADSRSWGFVPHSRLLGRAALVVWPLSRARLLSGVEYDADPLS
jgi:signal peptidase I